MNITLYIIRFLYRIRYQLIFGSVIVTGLVIYFSRFIPKTYTVKTTIYTGIVTDTGLNSDQQPTNWKSVENMWISGYFAHGYADDMICVESIDTIHKMIHTGQHTVYGFMTGAPWRQWFALNLLEEETEPH